MAPRTGAALFCCLLIAGGSASLADSVGESKFITEPQDAVVAPGGRTQLDCELIDGDVCSWRIDGTHLGVDHFYNVDPPAQVHALFPDHERVCSIVITDIDWRYDGYWTCWPLGEFSHYSSRAARVTVSGTPITTEPPTAEPTSQAPPEPSTTPPAPETSTPYQPTTTPYQPTTTPYQPTTTPYQPTTTPYRPSTTIGPDPDFVCPTPFGLFADPRDDSYFYFCEEGHPIHLQCEYPLHWDDVQKKCD
ncbi:platelet glycoprotein Ib alpha chain-like [Amphibalanus amphitrite]|uniref:platelet glycoprotein Ib alpha chain-like n=1 Tax=Amphibalanus amphitrite TaxID=1232801 RepID=UPI001C90D691|nr:platelet glycoprotein Ib alpha chain-like [Amphibalanus amphitrite]